MRFFVLALGITWSLQLPAVLAQRGVVAVPVDGLMPLVALGAFGPILAAVLCAWREGSVRALFRRALIWRVHPAFYVAALLGFAAIYVASRAVYALFGGVDARWLYPPENAQHVVAMVLVPIVEEVGWRGYALPRLLEKRGALRATAILGAAWAAWHLMMFLLARTSNVALVVSLANIFVGSACFTWLFLRTKGSLLLAILAHVGAHLNNPAHDERVSPLAIYTVGLFVVGVALYAFDRPRWAPRAGAEVEGGT